MQARIYRPAKSAMQSGRANTKRWVLEFETESPKRIERLMGWTASDDTRRQVKLRFESEEAAVAYAKKYGLDYIVQEPNQRRMRKKSYADNFKPRPQS
ncbi:MAG: ETC complex I subunit [Alphaproteobacteria bacterium]|nr:ETC complex I subunit [Alphaproteobacteria bacterium]